MESSPKSRMDSNFVVSRHDNQRYYVHSAIEIREASPCEIQLYRELEDVKEEFENYRTKITDRDLVIIDSIRRMARGYGLSIGD